MFKRINIFVLCSLILAQFLICGIPHAQVGNAPETVYYNKQQMQEIVQDLRANCDSWLPERILKFQYICSYDVELMNSDGKVFTKFHAQHPFTRGASLNILAETLLYGDYSPDSIYETIDRFVVVYRTTGFSHNFDMPSSLADMNGRVFNLYSSYWYRNSSLEALQLQQQIGVFDHFTAVYFDKVSKRLVMVDTYSEGGTVASLFARYKFKYSKSGNIESLEYYLPDVSSTNPKQELKYQFKYPPADSYFQLLTTYFFGVEEGIGYITRVANASGQDSMRISNFALQPWKQTGESSKTSFAFLRKHVYTRRDPTL